MPNFAKYKDGGTLEGFAEKPMNEGDIMKQYEMVQSKDLIAISLGGDFDFSSSRELLEELAGCIEPDMKVVFNMERIDFIDSAGLFFLLDIKRLVNLNRSVFVLCNPNHYVGKVIERVGLKREINLFRKIEDFLAKVAKENLASPAVRSWR